MQCEILNSSSIKTNEFPWVVKRFVFKTTLHNLRIPISFDPMKVER